VSGTEPRPAAETSTAPTTAGKHLPPEPQPRPAASSTSPGPAAAPDESHLVPLLTPRDGVPEVLVEPAALTAAAAALANGTGPVAADAERASGFRYGQHNYLVQLRRQGSGTFLIDTAALPDLSEVSDALRGVEWVFHAASQDLHPMSEQRLFPDRIFDTELAARLLGMPRVGLGAVIADVLGLKLRKEHSASDWSRRPLPTPWLEYAALDVEVLVALRDALAARLEEQGKLEWALQEFEHVRLAPPPAPKVDPWRHVSRITDVKNRRQLAVVRALWTARDENARSRDISPGFVLPDRAIIQAAKACPRSVPALVELSEFSSKNQRRRAPLWLAAITSALRLGESQLPALRGPRTDAPPQPRTWADRDPAAAARLEAARTVVQELAERLGLPVENLLQPDALRRLCWDKDATRSVEDAAAFLRDRGAREWQVEQVAGPVVAAVAAAPGARPAD